MKNRRYAVLTFAVFLSGYGLAADSAKKAPPCRKEKIPLKWRSCKTSQDCLSIYGICSSVAINKSFKKDVERWLAPCQTGCDASAVPIRNAACKKQRCELDLKSSDWLPDKK